MLLLYSSYLDLPWLYLTLLDSTLLYHASSWLYFTLLWLYFIQLHSTMPCDLLHCKRAHLDSTNPT